MSSIYANLPEVLLNGVLDFVPQEEMYHLVYDFKTERFVNRINPNYGLLNKVNQFKIDNSTAIMPIQPSIFSTKRSDIPNKTIAFT